MASATKFGLLLEIGPRFPAGHYRGRRTGSVDARTDACQPSQRHSRPKDVTAQWLPMYATLLGCDGVTPSAQ